MSSFATAYLSLLATPLNISQAENVHSFIYTLNKNGLNIPVLPAGDTRMNKEPMSVCRMLRKIYTLSDHRIYLW